MLFKFLSMFTKCPTVNDISNLCRCLREVLEPDSKNSPVQQVIWRGLLSKDAIRPQFSGVAEKVLYRLRCRKSTSKSLNETSMSPRLAEAALEGSVQAVSDSARRMAKVIHGQNSVQTVVSVTQIPQTGSDLPQLCFLPRYPM